MLDLNSSPTSHRMSCSDQNFAFAFNDNNFSDRILRIEIQPDMPSSKSGGDGFRSGIDWERKRNRKREVMNDNDALNGLVHCEKQNLKCIMLDNEDSFSHENRDVEDCSSYLQVKTIPISSPILVEKSPFFLKLFSGGMREPDQRHVTVCISASEEVAFMELLNFIHGNTVSITTPTGLLDVLMVADKFEVSSCVTYCSRLMLNLPMTCESALLSLDLPYTLLISNSVVQLLVDVAKKFLSTRFTDFSKSQEELLQLPLTGIEAVFSGDDIQIASEDVVFDFLVMKWACKHYPDLVKRQEVVRTCICYLIRFPLMSCSKLRRVLTYKELYHHFIWKHVLEALFFKSESPHRQRSLVLSKEAHHWLVERAYKYKPIKTIEFETPCQQCVVYLDLKENECSNLFPSGMVASQAFCLGGHEFFIVALCNMDQVNLFHCFGLFLEMRDKESVPFTIEYEFATRMKPEEDFWAKHKGRSRFNGLGAVGWRNLFGVDWNAFMADDNVFFINGILHLRVQLTLVNED